MLFLGARERRALAALAVVVLFLPAILTPLAGAVAPAGGTQTVDVSLPSDQSLNVFTPSPSSLVLLSVAGAQYEIHHLNGVTLSGIRTAGQGAGDEIVFVPGNGSVYSLDVNLSSPVPSYVLIRTGNPPISGFLKNVTGPANFSLDIRIAVTQSATQGSGWSALFGFTGLSIGGMGFSVTEVLIAVAIASVALIASGTRYSRKLLGVGLLLLIFLGLATLGFLLTGLALALYVASFVIVRSHFVLKTHGPRNQEGGAP